MQNELKILEDQIIQCRRCPRLVAWREEVAHVKRRAYLDWDYWGKPVPGFGDAQARLLILGLAPGAHGSNRTGRMFTGDGSGNFLFPALARAGFASQAESQFRGDGLELQDCWITAACRCAPPQNKPSNQELTNCQPWLMHEIALLNGVQGVVLLGIIALDSLLRLPGFNELPKKEIVFRHGAFYQPKKDLPWILCSYHPSMQNTQTGKLTVEMFDRIWEQAKEKLV